MRIRLIVLVIACIATVIFALYRRGGSGYGSNVPREMASMQIYSPEGHRLVAFFTGLPVEPRFSGGRNGYKPRAAEPTWRANLRTWMDGLWGIAVVHAQSGCNGCSVTIGNVTCGQNCGAPNEYREYTGTCSDEYCGLGAADNGYAATCNSECNVIQKAFCDNSAVCCPGGCGGGSGCGGCCSSGLCYCGGCGCGG